MSNVIEIPGNRGAGEFWSAPALCPMSGEGVKSIFCRNREECTLPQVLIEAVDGSEANRLALEAQRAKKFPVCLDGRTFRVGSSLVDVSFQPSIADPANYL